MSGVDNEREAPRVGARDWMWALGLVAALAGASLMFDLALGFL